MENSIEKIWKEGFLKQQTIEAPKINDLYNRKSIHLVDNFIRGFKLNLILIMVFATLGLIASFFLGIPWVGLLLFIEFSLIVYLGKIELDKAKTINHGMSSYDYLKSFDNWRKDVILFFTKVYRFFYPILTITVGIGACYSNIGKLIIAKALEQIPDLQLVYGIPLYWLIGVLIYAAMLSLFAKQIYHFDINLVYKHMFKRLEEMIEDMEELKN